MDVAAQFFIFPLILRTLRAMLSSGIKDAQKALTSSDANLAILLLDFTTFLFFIFIF